MCTRRLSAPAQVLRWLAIDLPQVCEGCTSETKVKLLAKRGALFPQWAVGAPLLSGRPPRPSVANRESNGRFCKNASLLAKSLTFVSEVQPSHTCGMSVAPLSSGLPTFPRNVDPSKQILKFSKRANSMRVSKVRLQSVIGVSFSGCLYLPRLPVSTASKRQTLSHFGISLCSLSCCLLVLKT